MHIHIYIYFMFCRIFLSYSFVYLSKFIMSNEFWVVKGELFLYLSFVALPSCNDYLGKVQVSIFVS